MPHPPTQNPLQSARNLTSPATVNPLALTVEEAARMLSAGGGKRVSVEQVQADIDAGAPTLPGLPGAGAGAGHPGAGGRINLVHYTAWLLREVQAQ